MQSFDLLAGSDMSDLVAVLESAWRAIQGQHPDLPDVVLLVAPPMRRGGGTVLGHWHAGQWQRNGRETHEVAIGADTLTQGARVTMRVLLHEAAHGLAFARMIQDTSRQGRWHNGKFKALAEELGLVVEACPRLGHTTPDMAPETALTYDGHICQLDDALRCLSRVSLPPVPASAPASPHRPHLPWKGIAVGLMRAIQDGAPRDQVDEYLDRYLGEGLDEYLARHG